jgi:hypothetical protein
MPTITPTHLLSVVAIITATNALALLYYVTPKPPEQLYGRTLRDYYTENHSLQSDFGILRIKLSYAESNSRSKDDDIVLWKAKYQFEEWRRLAAEKRVCALEHEQQQLKDIDVFRLESEVKQLKEQQLRDKERLEKQRLRDEERWASEHSEKMALEERVCAYERKEIFGVHAEKSTASGDGNDAQGLVEEVGGDEVEINGGAEMVATGLAD